MFDFLKKSKKKEEPTTPKKKLSEQQIKDVNYVAGQTGWTFDEAKAKMKDAKAKHGITFKDYREFKLYKYDDEAKQLKMYEKAVKEKAEQKSQIDAIIAETGWTKKEAKAQLSKAKKKGVSKKEYLKLKLYEIDLDSENFEEEYKARKKHQEEIKQRNELRIKSVMNATGWDHKYARAQMKDAKSRIGITFREYARYRFYDIPVEKQAEEYTEILRQKQAQALKKQKKNEKFINEVCEQTGWSFDEAKEKMDKATKLCGAEYKDYVAYEFWKKDEEEQKTFLTKGMANAVRNKYNTSVEKISCFMNKNEFNEVFEEYLGRPWIHTKDMSYDEFASKFANGNKAIYKPLSASCGAGIEVMTIDENNAEEMFKKISALPEGVLEGYIVQHPAVAEFSMNSVNTVRLVTLYDGNDVNLLYGAFRMGGGDAVVDNFHNGGVLALIDVTCGKVVMDAIDLAGEFFEYHPATNKKINGFQIPNWDKVESMIKKAGKMVDGIGYIGWDIAITEDGALLIEGNTAPAPNVLQLPYAKKENKGMAHVFTRFL